MGNCQSHVHICYHLEAQCRVRKEESFEWNPGEYQHLTGW